MSSVHTQTDVRALRDLSDEEFRTRYGADRLTTSILANRMAFIVEHMCGNLLHNAFSLILRDWYDFAATISGPPEMNYAMSTVSNSLVQFTGTMAEGVRNAVEEFGPERLRRGDVLIINDPYRIGNHLSDMCFIRPVFHQDRVTGFVTLRAHQLDMGGPVPAGFSATKRSVYETGLVLGPTLLYRDDAPVREAFNLILDNCRFAELMLPDMKTIYRNLLLGERLIEESIARYGVEAWLGAVSYSCDVSAEAMRAAISALPDGVYFGEETVDCDGVDEEYEYKVRVRITKVGENLEADVSGTSRQARTSINCTVLDAKLAVGVALKYLIDPKSPLNAGTYRNIDVVIPPGTLVSAVPPDGPVFLYWEGSMPLLLAMFRALENAVGENAVGGDYGSLSVHNGSGRWADGRPWVTVCQCGGEHGPWGATKAGDADSYESFYVANNLDPATEEIEADLPAIVVRKEYVTDSGGPGYNRGGAAVRRDTRFLTDGEHTSSPVRTKRSSGAGVHGGKDGRNGAVWLFRASRLAHEARDEPIGVGPDVYALSEPVAGVLDRDTKAPDSESGEYFYFGRTAVWRTQPGDTFRYITNGGGGWGSPLDREVERVLCDVRDEYVSIEGARRDYGVVISGDPIRHPEALKVDHAKTAALRASLRATGDGGTKGRD